MVDVFVSRPTWVPEAFKPGLGGFLRTLTDFGLTPRTIGVTDNPVRGAFDEVIDVMGQCSGAVILGYPQIWIRDGSIKDADISGEITLPTEWNHIEAALAIAARKPVLIIHDTGISRGVFDHGAVNSFIYEIDLANSGWPIAEPIHGALERWRSLVNARVADSSSDLGISSTPTGDRTQEIPTDLVKTLKLISGSDGCTAEAISEQLDVTVPKAEYFIDRLEALDAIQGAHYIGGNSEYYLLPKGREILFGEGLLE